MIVDDLADERLGIHGDHELLVRGDEEDGDLGVGRGDDAFFAADLVGVLVHLDAHELEAGGDGHALGSAVLADTCGEDDGVHAAHRGGIRTDELLHAVVEHIDGKAGALIALLEGLFEIAEVGADAADAHDAGLLVEDCEHLGDVHAVLVHQVLEDTGVNVAGAGTHGKTGERGEAHGGVDALAAVDRGDGGAVAEVAGDQLELLDGLAEHIGRALGNILVRGAVEAVAADLVLLIVLIGKSIGVSHGRHGLVEGSVEHGDHGHAGHELLAGLDADDVGGVVERGEGIALLDCLHDLVGDDDGLGKLFAAVDDAVADSVDLLHGADDAVLLVDERVQHGLDGLVVGGHGDGSGLDGFLAGKLGLIGEQTVDADTLAQTLRQQLARGGVEQLILQGRRTCVDDQNIHKYTPFSEGACIAPEFPIK